VPRLPLVAALLAATVLVGVAGQLADVAPGVPARATALGAPWLVAAFAAGALLRGPAAGALGGAVLLAGGTLAYYLVRFRQTGELRVPSHTAIPLAWAVAALAAGAVMGALGAAWRRRSLGVLAAAVPAAALAGEAILLAGEWRGRMAAATLTAELALAAVLLPACAWRRAPLPAVALAAALLALVFAAGEAELRGAMRSVGWRGT
jgi:hypothetical protein